MMMTRSVLLSKMDGEEGRCNATWVFCAFAWNHGAAPRLGAGDRAWRRTGEII